MNSIVIYTKGYCPFCHAAKALLQSKGVDYQEFDITGDAEKRQEMIGKAGRTTVPQIFIAEAHIGGYDDLAELESQGGLDKLLKRVA